MDLPENTLLPMFAYGVFQPGDLAFLRVKEFVSSATAASVSGALCVRDGLPLLDPENSGRVHGALLDFRPQAAGRAYYRVVELEPHKQYEWRTLDVVTSTTQVPANTLVGRDLKNGTVPFENEDDRWHGSEDPFFKEALEVVAGTLPPESQGIPHNDFHLLFRVQMG